jgi:hypothetical protein
MEHPIKMDDWGYSHFSKPPNRCAIFQILSTKKTELRALMKDRHCLTQGNRLQQGKMSCSALGRMETSMPRPGASKVILHIQPFISQLRPEFLFFFHFNQYTLIHTAFYVSRTMNVHDLILVVGGPNGMVYTCSNPLAYQGNEGQLG